MKGESELFNLLFFEKMRKPIHDNDVRNLRMWNEKFNSSMRVLLQENTEEGAENSKARIDLDVTNVIGLTKDDRQKCISGFRTEFDESDKKCTFIYSIDRAMKVQLVFMLIYSSYDSTIPINLEEDMRLGRRGVQVASLKKSEIIPGDRELVAAEIDLTFLKRRVWLQAIAISESEVSFSELLPFVNNHAKPETAPASKRNEEVNLKIVHVESNSKATPSSSNFEARDPYVLDPYVLQDGITMRRSDALKVRVHRMGNHRDRSER